MLSQSSSSSELGDSAPKEIHCPPFLQPPSSPKARITATLSSSIFYTTVLELLAPLSQAMSISMCKKAAAGFQNLKCSGKGVPVVATRISSGGGGEQLVTSSSGGSSSLPHQLWLPSSMCPKVITTSTPPNTLEKIEVVRNGASHTPLSNNNANSPHANSPPLDGSHNGDAFSSTSVYEPTLPRLEDDLFQVAPISLTSSQTSNLTLTVNVALLAARDHEQCWVDTDGGIIIGDGFCSELQCRSVSFEGTRRIKAIGNRMLQGCCAERISFGPMPWLRNVKNGWMGGCMGLRRLNFESDFISLQRVGDGWLRECSQLSHTDFSSFVSLESVGCGWLEQCISLTSFRLSNLKNLLWIGSGCLSRCSRLTTVAFSNMPNLTTVGDGWIGYCPMLKTAEFTHLPRLSVVGPLWIAGCPNISLVSLLGTDNICSVGPGWLMWSDGPQVQCTDTERDRIQRMLFESISSAVRVDNHQQA